MQLFSLAAVMLMPMFAGYAILQALPEVKVVSHSWGETLIMQLPAIIGQLSVLLGVLLGYRNLKKGQATVVDKVSAAADNAMVAADVANATHVLVNNEHGTTLKLAAGAAQRVAEVSGLPEDKQLAQEAKEAVQEHETNVVTIRNLIKNQQDKETVKV